MPLESTMICLDNSDWMRNGDYAPSRFEAEKDAAGLLCNDRLSNNPESTVGILTTAGHSVNLLVTPTQETGKALAAFSSIRLGGSCDIVTSVNIAQLALKHRKNKNGEQRIIIFVGSPISHSKDILRKLGVQLKKNSVAIDAISLGHFDENDEKLQELVASANSADKCHFLRVEPGVSLASALVASPVFFTNMSTGGTVGGSSGGMDGFNADEDPELAMAIRISMEEARAAEEARLNAQGLPSSQVNNTSEDDDSEEAMLRRALELSMQDFDEQTRGTDVGSSAANDDMNVDDEDADLQRALAMSRETQVTSDSAPTTTDFSDPQFVSQLLGSDPNDPLVLAALAQLQNAGNSNGEEKKENERKRKNEDKDEE